MFKCLNDRVFLHPVIGLVFIGKYFIQKKFSFFFIYKMKEEASCLEQQMNKQKEELVKEKEKVNKEN